MAARPAASFEMVNHWPGKQMPNIAPPNSVQPKTRDAWRDWLSEHHQQAAGVWLVTYKKATGKPRIDYDEAVEEALCFGWVDS